MGSKRELISLNRTIQVLTGLGCPRVRPAEGSKEWEQKRASFSYSPDLIAGPMHGNGHQLDFFIDVFHPRGIQYTNPKAGNPAAVQVLQKAVSEHGSFSFRDLGEPEQILEPVKKKIKKYSLARNSHMTGLVIYHQLMNSGGYVGAVLAHHHTIDMFDRYFGLTRYCGKKAVDDMADLLFMPCNSWQTFVLPFKVPLSFIMSITDIYEANRPTTKVVMLINCDIVSPHFEAAEHEVVSWLRSIT
jgi:hypothetical protein